MFHTATGTTLSQAEVGNVLGLIDCFQGFCTKTTAFPNAAWFLINNGGEYSRMQEIISFENLEGSLER